MNEYDLAIIGASFAGLSAARSAALCGTKTVVLEKKSDAGEKIHTTGILVNEITNQWDVPSALLRKITGIRLYSPSLDWIDLESPDYSFYTTNTSELLRWYANDTEKQGVDIEYKNPYLGSTLCGQRHFFPDKNISSRFLLGCDGARSQVARQYHLGINKQFLIGAEAEYEPVDDVHQNRLHVFLDSKLAQGYIGWIAPGIDCTQVGLATCYSRKLHLHEFVKKLSTLFNFDNAKLLGHRGGLIPCGGVVHPFYIKNVMVVGDSAGMVSPLTAGGIHPAIEIGDLAGEKISDYLMDGDLSHLKSLNQLIPRYRTKQLLRLLNNHVPVPNWMFDLALKHPVFRSFAQTVFFHHRGLFSMEAWRDLVRILQK